MRWRYKSALLLANYSPQRRQAQLGGEARFLFLDGQDLNPYFTRNPWNKGYLRKKWLLEGVTRICTTYIYTYLLSFVYNTILSYHQVFSHHRENGDFCEGTLFL